MTPDQAKHLADAIIHQNRAIEALARLVRGESMAGPLVGVNLKLSSGDAEDLSKASIRGFHDCVVCGRKLPVIKVDDPLLRVDALLVGISPEEHESPRGIGRRFVCHDCVNRKRTWIESMAIQCDSAECLSYCKQPYGHDGECQRMDGR